MPVTSTEDSDNSEHSRASNGSGSLDFSVSDPLTDSGATLRATDARLVEAVRAAGPGSPEFRYLQDALREAGLGALGRLGPDRILAELRRRRIPVRTPAPRSFRDELPTLRLFAVHTALGPFMAEEVLGGRWNPRGGASLRTYFTNKALYRFASEYRRYYREEVSRDVLFEDTSPPELNVEEIRTTARSTDTPESIAVDRDRIERLLEGQPSRVGEIVHLTADGYSQKEIAYRLGVSEEAVSSTLRRFRRRLE